MLETVVGTRESRLALIQAGLVVEALRSLNPGRSFRIKTIKTKGDRVADIPLEKIGDKGLFIKELEVALQEGVIDLAVHSMKDLPTSLAPGLNIGAVLPREEPWDALICAGVKLTLGELVPGTIIGCGSLRRRAELLRRYPHLVFAPIRGNLDTRLAKMRRGDYGALVLALAGIKRMGWEGMVSEVLGSGQCLPAAGQGAIGVETRSDDRDTRLMVSRIGCPDSEAAVSAERAFLRRLEGCCQVPIGALALHRGKELYLEGMVSSPDGKNYYRDAITGTASEPLKLGTALAGRLLRFGCGSVLEEIEKGVELS